MRAVMALKDFCSFSRNKSVSSTPRPNRVSRMIGFRTRRSTGEKYSLSISNLRGPTQRPPEPFAPVARSFRVSSARVRAMSTERGGRGKAATGGRDGPLLNQPLTAAQKPSSSRTLDRDSPRRKIGSLTRRSPFIDGSGSLRHRQSRCFIAARRNRRHAGGVVVRTDAPHDFLHGLFQNMKEGLRIQANPEGPDDQRDQRHGLAEIDIFEGLVLGVVERAKHGALVEPQQIGSAEHDAGDAEGGPDLARFKRSLQDHELADKAVERWQAER